MAGTAIKLNRVGRLVKLLTTMQSRQSFDVTELAELLGTSRRTVFRDLKELAAIGVPYQFDFKTGGYSIDPEFFLPPLDLNLQEAISLLMLVHKARAVLDVPFKKSAAIAGLKIENNLPDRIKQLCQVSLKNVSFKPGPKEQGSGELDRYFGVLQDAIAKKRIVELEYESVFEQAAIRTALSPFKLLYNQRSWYVIGHSSMHESVRTFKLSRIKGLQVLEKCYVDEGGFDVSSHIGKAWSMIPEGRIYDVKLLFSPRVARNVWEVQWHSTQQVTRHADGSATVEFRVDGIGEIYWWVLGYGDQVEVLGPKVLRNRIAQAAAKVVSKYSS